jgi:ubiquinone/menaquinone biosynthesis C-methylase UbiE
VSEPDPQTQRVESLELWERAAGGWGRRADRVREVGMPVSRALIDALAPQPGERILELAAGPGDTGFLAAELIRQSDGPRAGGARDGMLVCSDGAEAMLEVAKARARAAGIENVEFVRLELEWIDLPTASVDAALCRWGLMLITDREAAAREIRRVVRAGGRAALAVWDLPERNPWATIPNRAMIELGHAERPDPEAPGMFRLASAEELTELLESAGFVEVEVEPVSVDRTYGSVQEYLAETLDLSGLLRASLEGLGEGGRQEAVARIEALAEPFTAPDGSLKLPGSSLVACAQA